MAALDFLSRGRRDVGVAHFNHGTNHSSNAESFIRDYCSTHGIPLVVEKIVKPKPSSESWEEYWRNSRLAFFRSLNTTVVTAHHLDDVCEWWVFSSLHGNPRLTPSRNGNIIRPFLSTPKSELMKWCINKSVPFIVDPTNSDIKYRRNFIRNRMMENVFVVNPGLHKTISKKIRARL